MDIYLDQEFHEYFRKPIKWLPTIGNFNKPFHVIELISIGLVAEDGREYYAVSNEFDVKAAYNKYEVEKKRNYGDSRNISEYRYTKKYWLRDNVLKPIFFAFYKPLLINLHYTTDMSLSKMKGVIKSVGKSNNVIAQDIINFIYPIDQIANYYYTSTGDMPDIVGNNMLTISDRFGRKTYSIFDKELEPELLAYKPKLYGYYADYDWVVFCSLFGIMDDLPKGFPMHCIDLKQMMDECARLITETARKQDPDLPAVTHSSMENNNPAYPKPNNEHHALADARWNAHLHEFIKSL